MQKIYLTFDDGNGKDTLGILEVLKDKNVKATFFVVADRINTDILLRMDSEGHNIYNHSYSHKDMQTLSYEEQKKDIFLTNKKIEIVIGKEPTHFRPPYGRFNDDTNRVLRELGMIKVLWTLDSKDWRGDSADSIINKVLTEAKDNDIILFHDVVDNSSETLKALPIIIDKLREKGFDFITIK